MTWGHERVVRRATTRRPRPLGGEGVRRRHGQDRGGGRQPPPAGRGADAATTGRLIRAAARRWRIGGRWWGSPCDADAPAGGRGDRLDGAAAATAAPPRRLPAATVNLPLCHCSWGGMTKHAHCQPSSVVGHVFPFSQPTARTFAPDGASVCHGLWSRASTLFASCPSWWHAPRVGAAAMATGVVRVLVATAAPAAI